MAATRRRQPPERARRASSGDRAKSRGRDGVGSARVARTRSWRSSLEHGTGAARGQPTVDALEIGVGRGGRPGGRRRARGRGRRDRRQAWSSPGQDGPGHAQVPGPSRPAGRPGAGSSRKSRVRAGTRSAACRARQQSQVVEQRRAVGASGVVPGGRRPLRRGRPRAPRWLRGRAFDGPLEASATEQLHAAFEEVPQREAATVDARLHRARARRPVISAISA